MDIICYPDPFLKDKSVDVKTVDDEVRSFISEMRHALLVRNGLGLAAPQVGKLWRLFIAQKQVFINPKITKFSKSVSLKDEGCLSIPGAKVGVARCDTLEASALDEDGNSFSLMADGELARIIQHEYDHLEGILIIDRMSPIDDMANSRQLKYLRSVFKK